MSKITEINIQYAHERELLLKQYKRKAIDKRLYDKFLQQLNLSEQMDIMDEFLEGEE